MDTLRAIATCRVILWHAFGAAIISWFVAAMPTMFFVFGSLFAASAQRRSVWAVIVDRARRTLFPLAVFTVMTWTVMEMMGRGDYAPMRLFTWLLPFVDPLPTAWEQGWLSTPLWFLRVILWLLVLSPVLLWLMRRVPRLTIVSGTASIFAVTWYRRSHFASTDLIPNVWWSVGDLALYGTFMLFGVAHHQGKFSSWSRLHWFGLTIASAGAAGAWYYFYRTPLNVVNNSHPLHMFVGVAWLSLAFATRPWLLSLVAKLHLANAIRFLTQRALTLYLWHTSAIALVLWWLRRSGLDFGFMRPVVYLLLIAIGTFLLAQMFGWAEDLAAKRTPRHHWKSTWVRVRANLIPIGATTAALLALFVVAMSTSRGVGTTAMRPPPTPSQQPPAPVFVTERQMPIWLRARVAPRDLYSTVEQKLKGYVHDYDVSGVAMQVRLADDRTFTFVTGTERDGRTMLSEKSAFDVQSITKMMTATLVLSAVDEGKIQLDEPLPRIKGLREFPYDAKITPRMLLSHRSGLIDHDQPPEQLVFDRPTPVAESIAVSVRQFPEYEPGTETRYASVNFLVLGMLLESEYGTSYDDLFRHRFLAPLSLSNTSSIETPVGRPLFSTSGTVTTLGDLTTMTRKIFAENQLLSDNSHREFAHVDPVTSMGLGTMGFCPCLKRPDGSLTFYSVGHFGHDAFAVYVPQSDVSVALRVPDGIHDGRLESTIKFVAEVASLVANSVQGR